MPKTVDHEERRQLVAMTVAQIIGAQGLDAVTVRSVADAAGFSTKLVSRYFVDMQALLLYSYEEAARRATMRFRDAIENDPSDMRGAMIALLPVTAEALRDWQVWFAFWGKAIGNTEFAAAQVIQLHKARALFESALAASTSLSRQQLVLRARHLLTGLIGIALQAAHDPEDWSRRQQLIAVEELLIRE